MRDLLEVSSYQIPETRVEFRSDDPAVQRVFDDCERLLKDNIKDYNGRKVLIEGSFYRNVWLETQPMGGCMYAKRNVEVALNNFLIFVRYQRRDGRFPGMIQKTDGSGVVAYYDWMQGLYFAHHALRMCDWIGEDEEYLRMIADSLEAFYGYLMRYRTGNPDGIPETWCLWDTGEDNCARFTMNGADNGCWGGEQPPVGCGLLPFRSMEYAGYCYDMADTLAKIHRKLDTGREAEWRAAAEDMRARVIRSLWDEDAGACFDRDRNGDVIPSLSHINLRCMHLGLFTQEMADTFIEKHLLDPEEFWTKLPLTSTAIHDPFFVNDRNNNWSGACQGLTWQRAIDALLNYGRHDLVVTLGKLWIENLARNGRYVQQYDPFTGEHNGTQNGYGPTMLAALEYIAMMYGAQPRDGAYWFCAAAGDDSTDYTQHIDEHTLRVIREKGYMRALLDGREIYAGDCGVRVETDKEGRVLSVTRI